MAQSGQFRNEDLRVRPRPNRPGNGERQIPNRPQFLPDRVPDLTKDIADVVCGLDTDGVLIGLAGIKSLLVVPLLVLGVVIIRLVWIWIVEIVKIVNQQRKGFNVFFSLDQKVPTYEEFEGSGSNSTITSDKPNLRR